MKQELTNRTHFFKTEKIRFFGCFLLLLFSFSAFAQQDSTKIRKEANRFVNEAEDALAENNFPQAEANYRRAIAKDPANVAAKYNFGNAYYNKNKYGEAQERFKQAAEVATSKTEKHSAFHNLGNVFMNQKKYPEAIQAYKNALRSNPTDDESRYNLALAKKMWEKEQENQQNDQNDDQEQNDENQDDKEQDGEGGDQEKNEGDQSEEGDQGDQKENDKQEGEDKKDEEGKPKEPKNDKEGGEKDKQEQQPQQQQPSQGKLSPQQVKNLLEAMNNEEQKVQEKVNAQKVKGQPKRTEKDW